MKSYVSLAAVLLGAALIFPGSSCAQTPAPMTPQEDYAKRLRAAELVSPLTSDLFGDSVSLFNGATEFAVVDIDIPGNGGLPVQLRRRFKVESRKELSFLGGFGIWDIDVPYLHGVFDLTYKWNDGGSSGGIANRCSQLWFPRVHSQLNLREIWSGTQMHIPGEGDRELLHLQTTTHPVPTSNGPHPWTTRDGFRLRCKSTTANSYPGEGFIAVAPNGTKYTFDVGIERQQNSILKGSVSYGRVKVFLMASRMEDRHGNWVNYNYTAGRLTSITSSDLRSITLTYTGDRITQALAHSRTWTYQYGSGVGFPNGDRLDQVVRPDLSTWAYQYSTLPWHEYPAWDGTSSALCEEGPPAAGANFTLTATHPSGAVGAFNFSYRRQGRSGIPRHLACVADGQSNWSLYIANYYDGYTLTGKTISGPGLTPATWSYGYGDVNYGLITTTAVPCTTCQQTKVVVVTQPDGSRREHEFGVLWSHNEGRLVRASTVAPNNTVLRNETTQYVTTAQVPCAPFFDVVGINSGSDDPASTRLRPVNGTTITQQGVTFSSTTTCFDDFVRPVSVTRSSTLGHSRTEVLEYHDNLSLYAVGQVKKTTIDDIVASSVVYNAAALPESVSAFGKPQQTFTYQADGMLQTVTDGRNNTTTLSSWKRGIPQLIQFADTPTSMSAVVNDSGWITSVTDQNGFQTGYAYDSMGRLSTITFPSADTTNWNSKTFVFAQIGSSEYGIPAGHWRQTISNGAARKVSYFDALWRPVVTHEYDNNNMVGTQRFGGWKYDHDGRVSFAGYPRSSATNISSFAQGTTSEYDALGRPTRTRQDSELGLLDTTFAYLSNFQTQVINPRGHTTTTSYMAYDQPTTDWPIAITHPEGAYTAIARDVRQAHSAHAPKQRQQRDQHALLRLRRLPATLQDDRARDGQHDHGLRRGRQPELERERPELSVDDGLQHRECRGRRQGHPHVRRAQSALEPEFPRRPRRSGSDLLPRWPDRNDHRLQQRRLDPIGDHL
jgi:YD repeat-containing protein